MEQDRSLPRSQGKPTSTESHQLLPLHNRNPQSTEPNLLAASEHGKKRATWAYLSLSPVLSWKKELLTWLGSLCFFAGIVVALFEFHDRPVPELQFGITPNAIIVLLAVFTQTLMMVSVNSSLGQLKWLRALQKRPMFHLQTLDEASRGPWGSFMLLTRRTGGLLANSGAVITIVALAMGTFFQQALKYESVLHRAANATLPIAQEMKGIGSIVLNDGSASTTGFDSNLQSAPYVAVYSPVPSEFTPTARCDTGNCTWKSYETLAFCNTCKNISSRLNRTTVRIPALQAENPYDTYYYTLANNFSLIGFLEQPKGSLVGHPGVLNITTTSTPKYPDQFNGGSWDSVAFPGDRSIMLSVFAIGPSPHSIPEQPDKPFGGPMQGPGFAPPVAFECSLSLCLREMRAEYANGTLYEAIVSNWTDPNQPQNKDAAGNMTITSPRTGTRFLINTIALQNTRSWLGKLLQGNVTAQWNAPDQQWNTLSYSSIFFLPIHTAMDTSTTGLPDLMENVANSLTLSLRTIPYQPTVQGDAFSFRAVVTWYWLILPIFELVASLLLLIAVIIQTNKKGLTPWTNSILAHFFHGFDHVTVDQLTLESQKEMDNEARKLLVRFEPQEAGGRLTTNGE